MPTMPSNPIALHFPSVAAVARLQALFFAAKILHSVFSSNQSLVAVNENTPLTTSVDVVEIPTGTDSLYLVPTPCLLYNPDSWTASVACVNLTFICVVLGACLGQSVRNSARRWWSSIAVFTALAVLKHFPIDDCPVFLPPQLLLNFENVARLFTHIADSLASLSASSSKYIGDNSADFFYAIMLAFASHAGWILFFFSVYQCLASLIAHRISIGLIEAGVMGCLTPWCIILCFPVVRQTLWVYYRYSLPSASFSPPTVMQIRQGVQHIIEYTAEVYPESAAANVAILPGIIHGIFLSFDLINLVPSLLPFARRLRIYHTDIPLLRWTIFCAFIYAALLADRTWAHCSATIFEMHPIVEQLLNQGVGFFELRAQIGPILDEEVGKFRIQQVHDLEGLVRLCYDTLRAALKFYWSLGYGHQFLILAPAVVFYVHHQVVDSICALREAEAPNLAPATATSSSSIKYGITDGIPAERSNGRRQR
ncbi:hypothetical protein MIND_00676000 [Mycena indigotica]|uniref:Uncharacterized protein n=1 Tax=Mycena indigotica TaxID=2126181 RepID=A0A8H6SLC5_9AGAR|nr:uncharacterized protein MIND_00676000 [Mycena indigotica]KAF7301118.1 hypothetical protein MIND_00676000 [Mycena indigotica]